MRIDHGSGGYAFTPSDLLFASGGVVALPGMAIDHARFTDVVPLQKGFELVQRHLDRVGRPLAALCGFELRIPEALPWGQFNNFNERYFDRLDSWNLLQVDGASPLARTNVAPLVDPPAEAGVLAFSYTTEADDAEATYVVSGVAELMNPFRMPDDVIRAGESAPDALIEKARSHLGCRRPAQGVGHCVGQLHIGPSLLGTRHRACSKAATARGGRGHADAWAGLARRCAPGPRCGARDRRPPLSPRTHAMAGCLTRATEKQNCMTRTERRLTWQTRAS